MFRALTTSLATVCILTVSTIPASAQESPKGFGNAELLRRLEERDARALPLRQWIFLDYDMDYLRDTIPKAPEFNINAIQLSHGIGMYAENVINQENRARDVRELTRLAHEHDLLTYYWVHEIGPLPEEFRGPDGLVPLDEKLWDFTREKYEKFFAEVPDIDGVVLTLHETENSVYDDTKVASPLSRVERTILLIDKMTEICGAHGKTLICRTFAHTTDQVEWIGSAIQTIAARENPPDNLVIMSKCTPHDWQFYYPHNPFIGNVGGLPQIVEFDMGGEYWGSNVVPTAFPQYYHYRLQYDRKHGISGAAARLERGDHHAFGTPGEVNIYAYGKSLVDPDADPEAAFLEWCEEKYGKEAAPLVKSALHRCFEILSDIYFPRHSWINPHSSLPNTGYTGYVLETHDIARWDPHPGLIALKQELLEPTEGTITMMRGEKERALTLIQRSTLDIEEARPVLSDEDYAYLAEQFVRMKYLALAFRDQNELIFRLRQYDALARRDPDSSDLERIRREIVRHSEQVLETANRVEERFGQDAWPGNPRNMRALVTSPAVRRFRRHLVERPEYTAYRREGEITVDGDLSDWKAVPAITLDRPDQAKYVRSWRGPEDLSAWIYLVWDDESLYFAARTRDDMHNPRDVLLLGFDMNLGEREFGLEADDLKLRIEAHTGGEPAFHVEHGNVARDSEPSALATRVEGDMTYYEARFDWKELFGEIPEPGKTIGFSAAVIDVDTATRFWDGYLQWTYGFVEDHDAAAWGKVILGK